MATTEMNCLASGSVSSEINLTEVTISASGATVSVPSGDEFNMIILYGNTSKGSPYNVLGIWSKDLNTSTEVWSGVADKDHISVSGNDVTFTLRNTNYAGKYWWGYINTSIPT